MHHALPSPSESDLQTHVQAGLAAAPTHLRSAARVGIDTVAISGIVDSLAHFGERFVQRLFTEAEAGGAPAGSARRAERLAGRFAAKEAVIKALDLADAGVDWRQIEVVGEPGGRPRLALHGRVAELARQQGAAQADVSLSHDGNQACAVVAFVLSASPATRIQFPHTQPR